MKGFSGTKITRGIAFILIVVLWTYSTLVCMPPFLGWGYYAPEGLLVTCSYDYLRRDWNAVTFMYYAFAFNFFTPLIIVTFFYVQVGLRSQAPQCTLGKSLYKFPGKETRHELFPAPMLVSD